MPRRPPPGPRAPRCAVCKLVPDIQLAINRRLVGDDGDPAGQPPRPAQPRLGTRTVSAWLLQEHGIAIGFKVLNDHRNNHLEPARKAALRMAAGKVVGSEDVVSARAVAEVLDGSPKASVEVTALVDKVIADVTLLDRATAETYETLELVNRQIRSRIQAARSASLVQNTLTDVGLDKTSRGATRLDGFITKPEADYLPAAMSSIAMAAKARHAILTVKPTAGATAALARDAMGKAAGLKALLGNGPPPAIEGDLPDESPTEVLDPGDAEDDAPIVEMPAAPISGPGTRGDLDEDAPPESDDAPPLAAAGGGGAMLWAVPGFSPGSRGE